MTSEIMRLGDFCTFVAGSSFPNRFQGKSTGDYPFIKVSDMKLEMNQYRILVANNWIDQNEADELRARPIPAGSIVFAKIGLGLFNNRMRLTTMPTLMDNNMMAAIPKKGVSSDVLYSIMNTLDMQTWAIGAALPYVRGTDLEKIKLEHISFDNLSRTSEIESKINLMKDEVSQNSQILREIASVLFRSWFIDFDPVNAKAEDKLPYGMDKETAALFPNTFENSELGPIPTGWKWGQLGDCISVVGGGTPSTKNEDFWGGKYNWTSPKDLSNSNSIIMLDTERTITEAGLAKVSSGLLPVDTVLMSSRAPIGYLALSKIPVAINQGYIAIPPKNSMSPNFMLSWIHFNMPLIEAYSSGSTFPEISKKEFRKLPILIPPAELIEKFNEKTTRLYDSMETSLKQMNSLISTKDAILPRLMSGELKEI